LNILHEPNRLNKFLEHHRDLSVLLCAIISICWSLPPFFEIGNKYIRAGVGFYCSLKWNDSSIHSRIFLISLMFFNYIIPFFLVIYTNLRVWCTIRRLLKSRCSLNYSTLHITSPLSTAHILSSSCLTDSVTLQNDLRKLLTDVQLKETTNRLKRLKVDQRYAFLTAMIAAQYVIVWTPYAFISMLTFSGQTIFIDHYPFWPTLFALLAKFSLILNPLILIYTNKMTHS
jgi:hypothetical protein